MTAVAAAAVQRLTILGSTGTIGVNTLRVVAEHPQQFAIHALTAHSNSQLLTEQCRKFAPRYAVFGDARQAEQLQQQLRNDGLATEVLHGAEALVTVASAAEVDTVMAAIVGGAGLLPTLAAVRSGKKVLLANKEALVMAGDIFIEAARNSGAAVLPIDSEHNAIFQCLPMDAHARFEQTAATGFERIVLTASGGPFRQLPTADFAAITPEQACAHPNWVMGRKISVDSATLVNKGLELIEASYLFNTPPEQIDVVVHPQSIIHSLVYYRDGSVLAQLGNPDMRTPIAYGLAWPARINAGVAPLDLTRIGRLDFVEPDLVRFPGLALGRAAAEAKGAAPNIFNAANEIAVAAFLARQIGFQQIPAIIAETLNRLDCSSPRTLSDVLAIDARARELSSTLVDKLVAKVGNCLHEANANPRQKTRKKTQKDANMELIGSILFNVLAMLVTLGILVTFHEYGHFRVARLFGVQVERFSIGLGKVIYSWRGKADPRNPDAPPTEFAISILPLGGYVKMLGEQGSESQQLAEQQELDAQLQAGAFSAKPLSQRAAIIAAGPAANFVLAIFLYWIMFMTGITGLAPVVGKVDADSAAALAGLQSGDEIIQVDGVETPTWQEVQLRMLDKLGETGTLALTVKNADSSLQRSVPIPVQRWMAGSDEPNLLGDLGITPFHQHIPAKLEEVVAGGRAAEAGLLAGDLIAAANGLPITDWSEWLKVIQANPEQEIHVGIRRGQLPLELNLTPAVRLAATGEPELDANGKTQGYIGAQVELPILSPSMNRSVRYNPLAAVPQAVAETWENSVFVLVSMKKMLVGLISLKNLSGPITIAQVAGQTAKSGFEYYIGFLAVLSVSLGVFNLLPIPVLDGGHLFYYGMEAVLRRPVPRRVQEWGLQVGLMLVASFMFLALYNDVSRLF